MSMTRKEKIGTWMGRNSFIFHWFYQWFNKLSSVHESPQFNLNQFQIKQHSCKGIKGSFSDIRYEQTFLRITAEARILGSDRVVVLAPFFIGNVTFKKYFVISKLQIINLYNGDRNRNDSSRSGMKLKCFFSSESQCRHSNLLKCQLEKGEATFFAVTQ